MGQAVNIGSFLAIDDLSRVAESRRLATVIAEREGLSTNAAANVAIVASELASNLKKHATRGELHISPLSNRGEPGVEILSIDRGPGIRDLRQCLQDGFSTAGTAGGGLGAVQRLSDEFDIASQFGKGTVVVSQIFAKAPGARTRLKIGVAARPVAGETASGDAWAIRFEEAAVLMMVADGLGHGVLASDSANAAVEAFRRSAEQSPVSLVQAMHGALRGTRGAAVAVSRLEFGNAQVRFAGLGNIAGVIVTPAKSQSMVSHNGTAGYEARQIKEFVYPWTSDSLLVMHSDGLSTSWNPAAFPGLHRQHPAVIGGILYREAGRDRDDACVVVGKER